MKQLKKDLKYEKLTEEETVRQILALLVMLSGVIFILLCAAYLKSII
ncbi:MAG: hypothetical protein ACFFAU_02420 [Candidatus Hodarchaeota archaeon]